MEHPTINQEIQERSISIIDVFGIKESINTI